MAENEVALIVGGGPGISASCARLFAREGLTVAIAARTIDKPALKKLQATTGASLHSCDAADPGSVADLFTAVSSTIGTPRLVVHNIDGRVPDIFGKEITEADPALALQTIENGAFSAFLVAQQAARYMLAQDEDGTRKHRRAGVNVDDNLADPDSIAAMYMHLHRQPRSTWAFEVVLRPWSETW